VGVMSGLAVCLAQTGLTILRESESHLGERSRTDGVRCGGSPPSRGVSAMSEGCFRPSEKGSLRQDFVWLLLLLY